MTDEQFFAQYPERQARIRIPLVELTLSKQRSIVPAQECEAEFQSLGDHQRRRRRILLWRVPEGNPWYDPRNRRILKIPFLLFADETVEDDDAMLLPIIHQLMAEAAG